MLFNSLSFLLFFPVVCAVYFLLRDNRWRIPFLLLASYYFYMNWKPVYAVLIMASTVVTYLCGLLVDGEGGNRKRKKLFLVLNIVINLGILSLFKYHNFLNDSVFFILDLCGMRWPVPNLDLLLPVGISFYTFQAVGYSVDVYRGTIRAERNFLTYALFVSFFPQLVAGPIERARNLLPQFHAEHSFSYDNAAEGLKQMLWGYFMKLCVADVLAEYVDAVFDNIGQHNGASVLLAAVFFSFQIYCDFGGYSNIAIGAARVMGFRLMENFHRPYLSPDIRVFWKRWHISLSSWFMDYVYIPLGGNRVGPVRHKFNLLVTFIVSGLWHGANWTFVLWGALHGFYQVLNSLLRRWIPGGGDMRMCGRVLRTLFCYLLVVLAWVFFRANTVDDAFAAFAAIISQWGMPFVDTSTFVVGFVGLAVLVAKDVKDELGWRVGALHSRHSFVRFATIIAMICYILVFGSLDGGQFIYFQF